ncbi:MAG: T9SS C-terminal target domain-containing protein [Candidatus Riflebacteria bacterium]|nr:T9SS C-terminal target domain-containing protein [Candidatus Riflebacteria bacterium]
MSGHPHLKSLRCLILGIDSISVIFVALVINFALAWEITPVAADSQIYLPAASEILWQNLIGGSGADAFNCVRITSDGGCIAAGYTHSFDGDIVGNHGKTDALVVKFDSSGNIQWKKCYGGSEDDIANAIERTSDGGYVFAGSTDSYDGDVSNHRGANDFWVVKLSSGGAIQWNVCLGGAGEDMAASIQEVASGGYIVAGTGNSFDTDIKSALGGTDAIVFRLSPTGAILWQKNFGTSGDDMANCIRQTSDYGFVFVGKSSSVCSPASPTAGLGDLLIVRLATDGSQIWQRNYGGVGEDTGWCVRQTGDGGFIIAGSTDSDEGDLASAGHRSGNDAWIVKTDSMGLLQWQKTYGGLHDDAAYAVRLTADGSYALAGESASFDDDASNPRFRSDAWLCKITGDGTSQWHKCFGGRFNDIAQDMEVLPDGSWIFVGKGSALGGGDILQGHAGGDAWIAHIKPNSTK